MTTCIKCKTPNGKGAKRCAKCGYSLVSKVAQEVACPRCGAPHHPSLRYCAKCGANTAPNALALTSMMSGARKAPDPLAQKTIEKGDRNLVLKMVLASVCVAVLTLFVLGDKSADMPQSAAPVAAIVESPSEPAPEFIPDTAHANPPAAVAEPAAPEVLLPPIAVASPAENSATPALVPVQKPAPVSEAAPKPKRQKATRPAPAPVARESKAPVAEPAPKKPEAEHRQCSDLTLFQSLQCKLHGPAKYFRCAPDGANWNEAIPGCKISGDQ